MLSIRPPRAVVLGAGNPHRHDDGAGTAVARQLAGRVAGWEDREVDVREVRGETAEILDAFGGADLVIVADATASGAPPGTLRRFDAAAAPLPAAFAKASSHGLGVAEAVELARVLGRLPQRLVLYGIEGADFGHGDGLSPVVAGAVEEVMRRVMEELGGGAKSL